MRNSADFHKLEFIFSLGITPDMLSNLTLKWKMFKFFCMVQKCPNMFSNNRISLHLKKIGVLLVWVVVLSVK